MGGARLLESMFRLAEEIPHLVWIIAADGSIRYWNRRCVEFTGIEEPDAHDLINEVVHPGDRASVRERWTGTTTFEVECRLRDRSGKYRWFLSRAVPYHDESGRVVEWFGTSTDIQAQKEAEGALREMQRRLSLALQYSGMASWELDFTTGKIWRSEGYDALYGYGERLGDGYGLRDWLERVHPEDRESVRSQVVTASHGGDYAAEFRVTMSDGSIRWLLSRGMAHVDRSGEPVIGAGTTVDITRLKETEARLHEAVKTRDLFLGIASHELKTPLTVLRMQLQTLSRLLSREDGQAARERIFHFMRTCDRQISTLSSLVDDLLDVSRIRHGRLDLAPEIMDLGELVAEVAAKFADQLSLAGCELEVRSEAPVRGHWDRSRIEQVIVNLLTNAMKYAPGKPIVIDLKSIGDIARLVVKDHGSGIPVEKQAQIFECFERAAQAAAPGGMGLGLYISREILRMHGGSIRVESEPGLGSAFVVELPVLRSEFSC